MARWLATTPDRVRSGDIVALVMHTEAATVVWARPGTHTNRPCYVLLTRGPGGEYEHYLDPSHTVFIYQGD